MYLAHCFIREKEYPWSVSLRDIARFKKLLFWFYSNLEKKKELGLKDLEAGQNAANGSLNA